MGFDTIEVNLFSNICRSGGDGSRLQKLCRDDDLFVLCCGPDDPGGALILLQLLVPAGHRHLGPLHLALLLLVGPSYHPPPINPCM